MIYLFHVECEAHSKKKRKKKNQPSEEHEKKIRHTHAHTQQTIKDSCGVGQTLLCTSCRAPEVLCPHTFMVVWSNISHGDKLRNDIALCKFMCLALRCFCARKAASREVCTRRSHLRISGTSCVLHCSLSLIVANISCEIEKKTPAAARVREKGRGKTGARSDIFAWIIYGLSLACTIPGSVEQMSYHGRCY